MRADAHVHSTTHTKEHTTLLNETPSVYILCLFVIRRSASLLNMPTSALGVSANADPSQWHGSFDCAQCSRTSLPAMEFSAKMQQKRRADVRASIKCKRCVESAQAAERALSAMRIADDDGTLYACSVCKVEKPASGFSRAQLNSKSADARRCSTCRDAEAANAATNADAKVQAVLRDARAASAKADATLADFAREAALEAELVMVLKPKKISGGRGRGRGRGANTNSMLGRGRGGRA